MIIDANGLKFIEMLLVVIIGPGGLPLRIRSVIPHIKCASESLELFARIVNINTDKKMENN